MRKSTGSAAARRCTSIQSAVLETLEVRRLLAAPVLLDPVPRADRADYIASDNNPVDEPVSRFEWEYSGQRLVYRFDQPTDVQRQDLILTRLNDGTQRPAADAIESVSGFSAEERFTFAESIAGAQASYTLPSGNYEAILRAGGPFDRSREVDLDGPRFAFGGEDTGHSAQFLSTNMKRSIYWSTLLRSFGL